MNNERRERLFALAEHITDIREELDGIREEEQEYYDNMPENFQGGDKGDKALGAIGQMEEAVMALDEVYHNMDEAQE